ncbi:MAG: GIY-YIG nuclease family protein [Nitrospinae bacterium]|nr:GIY-YIG nuclease family protein [Nitrospinota bacterium]
MTDSGLYAIVLNFERPVVVEIGKLGKVRFPAGSYVYVGSAKRGLSKRIARHSRKTKPLRWHIDYLRARAGFHGSSPFPGALGECRLAVAVREILEGRVFPAGFGSSDCRCGGHLIHTGKPADKTLELVCALGKIPAGSPAFNNDERPFAPKRLALPNQLN